MSDDAATNTTNPRTPGMNRRGVLTGGALAAAGLLGLGTSTAAALPAAGTRPGPSGPVPLGPSDFTAVAASQADTVTVPAGFTADVLAPWGLPLRASGPKSRADGGSTAAEQALQIGTHHHGIRFFPTAEGAAGSRRGLLVINHETSDRALLGGGDDKALAAQGVSVVAVRESGGRWRAVDSRLNRRLTGDTPVRFSGPVKTAGQARGVLACGGHGVTPWGTYLAAEENFNAFFGTDAPGWQRREADMRYGLSAGGFGHAWHRTDPRFDLASPEARPEDFGWVVEFDPGDPSSVPVKRTALGRFMHGGATVTEAAGRVVVYSSDAEDGEYLYKYVGEGGWRSVRAAGRSPLDHGTLYVARISPDGSGRWLPLRHGEGPLTRAAGWRDQADVLLRARLAADALGATPLGRPERVAVGPAGDVYLALANSNGGSDCGSSGATGDPASAECTGDPYGRIIRWHENHEEQGEGGGSFHWEEFLTAGDPRQASDGAFAAPKGLWFGADGTLWISTGISGHDLNGPSAAHRAAGNNALLAADTTDGTVRRFLTAPRGAEVTGVTATPDGRTLFVNIQHPGERTARWGAPDADDPGAVSTWPGGRADGRPRSATVAVHRSP
ncbi:PhoX family protein [Streptomyces kurssanovii]|uniref:Alkaline phosphatase PhoX n=1 Tax=Streptomyces kurssanovii TaxID=67312 RepID=A0ABV3HN42_9ACTN